MADNYTKQAASMRNAFRKKPETEPETDTETDEESSSFASRISSGLEKLRKKGPPASARTNSPNKGSNY